jgi:hypothetical protein
LRPTEKTIKPGFDVFRSGEISDLVELQEDEQTKASLGPPFALDTECLQVWRERVFVIRAGDENREMALDVVLTVRGQPVRWDEVSGLFLLGLRIRALQYVDLARPRALRVIDLHDHLEIGVRHPTEHGGFTGSFDSFHVEDCSATTDELKQLGNAARLKAELLLPSAGFLRSKSPRALTTKLLNGLRGVGSRDI